LILTTFLINDDDEIDKDIDDDNCVGDVGGDGDDNLSDDEIDKDYYEDDVEID